MSATEEEMLDVLRDMVKEDQQRAKANGGGEESESSEADSEITRLAKLSLVEYDHQRKTAAENLGLRASILDRLVQAERARLNLDDGSKQGHAIAFPDPEPWPDPVVGAALLDNLAAAIRRSGWCIPI
jgi:putative DNA primase/helicase